MTIDFHDKRNSEMYHTREADESWLRFMQSLLPVNTIKVAADIGCGGGIYTKALSSLGINKVVGVDFSTVMIEAARSHCRQESEIHFVHGDAVMTNLPAHTFQLVLQRALIHHITDLQDVFSESFRLLEKGGYYLIQDRTPEDCRLKGTSTHLRGYIFDRNPALLTKEVARRHDHEIVEKLLLQTGFTEIQTFKFWETRRTYTTKESLLADLRARSGRSILHELNDEQLERLVEYIDRQLDDQKQIVESDRWTVWLAKK